MSASLVGSEMCIRDRDCGGRRVGSARDQKVQGTGRGQGQGRTSQNRGGAWPLESGGPCAGAGRSRGP
eukprot:4225896-Alexandrium_andersonii.AAC.1